METPTKETIDSSCYSGYLEEVVKSVYDLQPTAIATVAILPDGSVLSNYYEAGWMDRLMMAGTIQTDAFLLAVKKNREEIEATWEEEEEEELEELGEEGCELFDG